MDEELIFFQAKVEVEDILFESTGEKTAISYTVHLNPSLVFRNILPYDITLLLGVFLFFIKLIILTCCPSICLSQKVLYFTSVFLCLFNLHIISHIAHFSEMP